MHNILIISSILLTTGLVAMSPGKAPAGLGVLLGDPEENIHIVQQTSLPKKGASSVSRSALEWATASCNIDPAADSSPKIIEYSDLIAGLQAYITRQKELFASTTWLGAPLDPNDKKLSTFSDHESKPITPVVFKLISPPESLFYFWGDLHGDIQALAQSLQKLVDLGILSPELDILHDNAYLFFLGDITDRGHYACEVITLLSQLACRARNTHRVFLIRGNHEDISLNARYGFVKELNKKFGAAEKQNVLLPLLAEFYNLMPVAGFVGCGENVVQCCHGGIEPGYNPTKLLNHPKDFVFEYIQELSPPSELVSEESVVPAFVGNTHFRDLLQLTTAQMWLRIAPECRGFWQYQKGDQITSRIGFMWSDFNGSPGLQDFTLYQDQRGIMYGKTLTDFVLNKYSKGSTQVRGFIRGHQHNDTLPELLKPNNKNVWSLWNNKVVTTVATSQFETGHMAFVRLKTAPTYEKWQLTRYSKTAEPSSVWQDR